jgi:hypothetical protein
MDATQLGLTPEVGEARWAIRHNGSVLGYAESQAEAVAIMQDLASWMRSHDGLTESRQRRSTRGRDPGSET